MAMRVSRLLKGAIVRTLAKGIVSSSRLRNMLAEVLVDDRVQDSCLLPAMLLDDRFLRSDLFESLVAEQPVAARLEFDEQWTAIRRFAATDRPELARKLQDAKAGLRRPTDVRNALLDVITEGEKVFLQDAVLRFPDRHSLWTLIHEILVSEDYYFETDTQAPRILDCGTHFGLAIHYYKSLYPQARITGFEPVPGLRQLALENARRNKYANVEILPYALGDREGEATFLVSGTYSMAGSLTDRRRQFGDKLAEIVVECRRLSGYLDKPVHFLKLDIEGSENEVLAEAEPYLGNVQCLVCEYHHGMGLNPDRLGKLLLLLDRAGFDSHLAKTSAYRRKAQHRPMASVADPFSAVIWAKNRAWPRCQ